MLSSRTNLAALAVAAGMFDLPANLRTTKAGFKMKTPGRTYPFSSARQDERQRRQFRRDATKWASRHFHRLCEAAAKAPTTTPTAA